tara:strand:+ start:1643 stop:2035 length:393 start_codon:yes stop_codon:yes gene_type:complete
MTTHRDEFGNVYILSQNGWRRIFRAATEPKELYRDPFTLLGGHLNSTNTLRDRKNRGFDGYRGRHRGTRGTGVYGPEIAEIQKKYIKETKEMKTKINNNLKAAKKLVKKLEEEKKETDSELKAAKKFMRK